ncbi:MAG: hypothetical protein Q4B54_01410 [Coriobacteriales bacterium]|nr:hypothetical protein [Coriobacteriales bacterium]
MNTRCLYITGISAIRLMRAARAGEIVTATPAEITHVEALDPSIASLGDLQIDALLDWLNISEDNPLEVLAPSISQRHWFKTCVPRVLSNDVPCGTFLELHSGSNADKALSWPTNLHIFIGGPALLLCYMSHYLSKRVIHGKMTKHVMKLRLIEFACECCGSYARDPFEPRTGECYYDLPNHDGRLTNLSILTKDIRGLKGIKGFTKAASIMPYVLDFSGSPAETYVDLALLLPPRLGGYGMVTPLINEQLVTDDAVRSRLRHKRIRPDVQWPDYHMLAEYLGDKAHAGKSRRVEDKNRMLDYAEAHYTPFTLMYDDVCNTGILRRTAEMLARAFTERGKKGELLRVQRLNRNEKFLARQQTLMMTLLPPITRYEQQSENTEKQ